MIKPNQSHQPTTISSCLNDLKASWKQNGSIAGIWQEWPRLAGPQLAPHCLPLSFRHGILVIGANHPQWRQALQYNRPQLLAALRNAGHDVKDLRIQQHHSLSKEAIESEQSIWARHPSRSDVHGMTSCSVCKSPAPAGEMALWGKCGFCRRKQLSQEQN